MSRAQAVSRSSALPAAGAGLTVPAVIAAAGGKAAWRFAEFFTPPTSATRIPCATPNVVGTIPHTSNQRSERSGITKLRHCTCGTGTHAFVLIAALQKLKQSVLLLIPRALHRFRNKTRRMVLIGLHIMHVLGYAPILAQQLRRARLCCRS
jgi:hypothetical protein